MSFTLKGTIGKLNPPAKIFLLQDGNFNDFAILHNGAFELKGTVDAPQYTMLLLVPSGKLNDAYTGPSIDRTFFFLGEGSTFFHSADSLKNAKITGAKLTTEYENLQALLQPINNKMQALMAQYPAAPEQQSPELMKRLEAQKEALTQERNQQTETFIKANPESYVSLDALQRMGGPIPQYAKIAPLYNALSPTIRNSQDGRAYGARLQVIKAAIIGTQHPDDPAVKLAVERYEEGQEKILSEKRELQNEERNKQRAAYIKANPNSYESLEALKEMAGPVPDYAKVMPLYNVLAPAVKNTPEGKAYGQMLENIKVVSVGAQAPNFTQNTPDGKEVSLADYRGKYVLVDFWASWCGPCRAENPNLTKVYNEYKNRNFDILGVSLDDEKDRAKWLRAIKDDQLAWTQVSDLKGRSNEVATRYFVQAIPQNFLVGPTGKIVATNLRGDDLKATLARYIK
ncbi:redoxin domain-containing protein [Hymenobacter sp. YC55]|uniref:redoxin domain-containing protein n=1 Tax=Hymenobacter sp. YC55 TaxID=3034019 RepID=UPI0023FA22D8|nr:redoxin domain-containing protein [Hymenobacter sp. YC55]MDF7813663.1 redoxin domain-containing protein [Hymenobacter sp. YC55]